MRWSPLFMLALLPLGGCPVSPEGEPVGTFDVVGGLVENSCGSTGVAAIDPLQFIVELREDEVGRAYWRRPEAAIVYGTVVDGRYRFNTSYGTLLYDADPIAGTGGCALVYDESIDVTRQGASAVTDAGVSDAGAPDAGTMNGDAGAPTDPMRLSGSNVVQLRPAPGSDCAAALAAQGGPFLELPCRVEYDLNAVQRDSVF